MHLDAGLHSRISEPEPKKENVNVMFVSVSPKVPLPLPLPQPHVLIRRSYPKNEREREPGTSTTGPVAKHLYTALK